MTSDSGNEPVDEANNACNMEKLGMSPGGGGRSEAVRQ